MELVALRMVNFLSHEDTKLDFKKFNVAVVLGCRNKNFDSSNGSGKSSIPDAIGWVLFEILREKNIDILKWGEKEGFVRIKFLERGQLYLVKRTLKKTKKGITSKIIFKVRKGDSWDNLTDSGIGSKINTQKKIEDLINSDAEIFLNTCYIKQGEIGSFMKLKTSERREVFSKPEGLMVYQKAYKLMKKELSESRTNLRVLIEKVSDFKSSYRLRFEDEEDLEDLLKKRDELKKRRENTKIRIEEIEENKKKYSDSESSKKQIELLQKAINDSKQEVRAIKETFGDVLERGKEIEDEIEEIEKKINKVDHDSLLTDKVQAESIKDSLTQKIRESKEQIKEKEEELKKLKKVCSECGAKLTDEQFVEKKESLEEEITNLSEDLEDMYEDRNKMTEKIEELTELVKESSKNKKDLEKKKDKLKSYHDAWSKLEQARIVHRKTKEENEPQIEKLNKKVIDKKTDDTVYEELKEKYDSQSQKLGKLKLKISDAKEIRDSKLEEVQKFISLLKEFYSSKKKVDVLESTSYMLSNKGIQSDIIKEAVPELERYSNEVIEKFEKSDMSLKILTEDEKGNDVFDWIVTNRGQELRYHSLSGGEKIRVNFAFRIGNGIRCAHVKGFDPNFLLIDEISELDHDGIEDFVTIVRSLSKMFKHIIVISHIPEIKEYFSTQIVVSQKNNTSRVKVLKR